MNKKAFTIIYKKTSGKMWGFPHITFYSCILRFPDKSVFYLTRDNNVLFGENSMARFETKIEAEQAIVKAYESMKSV